MLGNLLRQHTNQLTLTLRQSIVIRYPKTKSAFDTTSYNPDWIPRQKLYHKLRKPRMAIWSDPNKIVPYNIPAMRRPGDPRNYVKNVIEEEEKERSMRKKLYLLDPIRAGDIVDITYQETYENESLTTHRGLVLSFKRRN